MERELIVEMRLRGFSENTIDAYVRYNKKFLEFSESSDELSIKEFLAHLIGQGRSTKTISLVRAALLFHYNELKGNTYQVKAPKLEKKLPSVLDKNDVRALITHAGSSKSRRIIKTLYSTGLRVSELCMLTPNDLASDGMLTVRKGKGKKMRRTVIDTSLAQELLHHSGTYLFMNRNGTSLTPRTVQSILATAKKRAGIAKNVTPHVLRHSFATHLLEDGVSIRVIQELLGHENLQTTQIYTHISEQELRKVANPLSGLE